MTDMPQPQADSLAPYQRIGLAAGPAAALLVLALFHPEGLPPAGARTAAVAAWMAIWWATEAVPFAVTALLPLIFFPALGILPVREASAPYANPTIFLFMGGFVLALTIERWNLHKRIAVGIFRRAGANGITLVGGFMLAAALLSMWLSNTSTTLMLLPIAMSVVTVIRETVDDIDDRQRAHFSAAMVLGLAFGATIGGMATLVGTPPNAFLAGFMSSTYGIEIGFFQWMMVGLPLTAIMLPLTWLVLTRFVFSVDFQASDQTRRHIAELAEDLGPMRRPETRVALLFGAAAAAWAFRGVFESMTGIEGLSDAGIAITAAVLAFIIPSGEPSQRSLLTWEQAARLPWGILLMFGGGLSLAAAVSSSGLAAWLGESLQGLGMVHYAILILAATVMVIFLTELTSNLATTATFLPVMGALALQLDHSAMSLVAPVTLAASCAFMLPIATPPNAIAFSSGYVSIPTMARTGFALNILGALFLSLIAVWLVPMVFG